MPLRDHEGIVIDEFNGLWQKGDPEDTPNDHFQDCENIRFIGNRSFGTRYGIDKHQTVAVPLGNVVRIYNYITQDENTLLALTYDGTTGRIYHVVSSSLVHGPILTKVGMEDFGFTPYAGRAYISPFKTYGTSPNIMQKGLQNEFLYVYKGDGSAARKAAGAGPTGSGMTVANGAAGNTDAGFHLFGVVYETDTGYLTTIGHIVGFTTAANFSVSFANIPVSPDTFVVARRIVATKVIVDYNGDTTGYQFFFLPNGRIPNNTATTLSNITFFDADLLEDASHLIDNFSEIAAGVALNIYHDRLCLTTEFNNISLVRVSAKGEPEAINQIDGFLIFPLDGNPITQIQELRDVLYVMKRNRTGAFVDNEDVPTSWPFTFVDQAIGCPVHGIATVLDSGGSNVDFLIVASYKGIVIFNGRYAIPELSWKISDFWLSQDRNEFRRIQILNDSINQEIYIALPDRRLMVGNYANGLDPKKIRWTPYRFDIRVNAIALVNINDLIISSEGILI